MQFRFAQPLTPALSQGEREEEREAIRRLNPAIPGEVSCLRGYPVRGRRFFLPLARLAVLAGEIFHQVFLL